MEFKKFDVNAAIDAVEKQVQTAISYMPEKAQHQAEVISEANFKLARTGVEAVNSYTETVMQIAKDTAASMNETLKSFNKFTA